MKARNYITVNFHQEMGQEYSKIVQIIVKADRGKAIAWCSVSYNMTCYYILDEKNYLDSQSVFCTHPVVNSLHFVPFRMRNVGFSVTCNSCCVFERKWSSVHYCTIVVIFFNQILLEVLTNCTKHFDFNSPLTASCVARLMICWVCRLYFSGLVCSVLSLDECLIKSNYRRFCVCFRCL